MSGAEQSLFPTTSSTINDGRDGSTVVVVVSLPTLFGGSETAVAAGGCCCRRGGWRTSGPVDTSGGRGVAIVAATGVAGAVGQFGLLEIEDPMALEAVHELVSHDAVGAEKVNTVDAACYGVALRGLAAGATYTSGV